MKEEIHSIVGREASFEGKLAFEGTVRVDGTLKGEVISEGTLIVGEEGRVEGTIQVGALVVHGHVEGDCDAKERVELRDGARYRGNIRTPVLVIEEGVKFNGSCCMDEE